MTDPAPYQVVELSYSSLIIDEQGRNTGVAIQPKSPSVIATDLAQLHSDGYRIVGVSTHHVILRWVPASSRAAFDRMTLDRVFDG